jgi:hypothetical protein
MSLRRTFQIGVVALSLGGAFAPMLSNAQVTGGAGDAGTGRGAASTTTDDRRGPDFGWIGILGLAGLAGLMGNKREDRSALNRTATQTR